MRLNTIPFLLLALLGAAWHIAYGVEIHKSDLDRTNSFLVIKSIKISKPNNELIVFTVTVLPRDGHDPKKFEGFLEIKERGKRIANSRIQSFQPRPKNEIPEEVARDSSAFEFEISSSVTAESEFTLVEPHTNLDPAPQTYVFNLGEFKGE